MVWIQILPWYCHFTFPFTIPFDDYPICISLDIYVLFFIRCMLLFPYKVLGTLVSLINEKFLCLPSLYFIDTFFITNILLQTNSLCKCCICSFLLQVEILSTTITYIILLKWYTPKWYPEWHCSHNEACKRVLVSAFPCDCSQDISYPFNKNCKYPHPFLRHYLISSHIL